MPFNPDPIHHQIRHALNVNRTCHFHGMGGRSLLYGLVCLDCSVLPTLKEAMVS